MDQETGEKIKRMIPDSWLGKGWAGKEGEGGG